MTPDLGLGVPVGFDLPLGDVVDAIGRTDCEFLELLLDGATEPDSLPEDLHDRLADAGLDATVHLPFAVPVAAGFDAHREGCLRTHEACLDAAAALDARKAVVHPTTGAWSFPRTEEALADGVLAGIRRLDAHAAESGVELCVENVTDGPFTLDGCDRLLAGTDASLTLDTGHARVTGAGVDEQAAFAREHADRLSHVHLNDTRGPDDEHLPFGAGDFPFEPLFEALDGWTGTYCVEAVVGDADYLVESLERARAALA